MRISWNARTRRLLFVLVMLFVLTYPLINTLLTRARVERDGVDVTAAVAKAAVDDDRYLVAFRLPEDLDPEQVSYSAFVSRATYDKARTTKQVSVRVLEDEPGGTTSRARCTASRRGSSPAPPTWSCWPSGCGG